MTSAFGRVGGGFEHWVQTVEDRLARLEGRRQVSLGSWVLRQFGDRVVLVYSPTGEQVELAAPSPPDTGV